MRGRQQSAKGKGSSEALLETLTIIFECKMRIGDPNRPGKSKQKEREKVVDGEKPDQSDLLWYLAGFCELFTTS